MKAGRGFTLVEVVVVLAAVAILAGIAWPASASYLSKARRADAIASLTRLQFAQERFHALHGLYAADLRQLSGASSPRSDEGHYEIRLVDVQPHRYTALAVALPGGPQARDTDCGEILVQVHAGTAEHGPQAACWNR